MTNIIGPSFEELSNEEMQTIQGSGDVQAETTPVCAVAATAAASSGVCAATGAGIATGVTVVVSLKSC
ncbi:mersacidin family lantibiotic [Priestia megaterium]|jgi:type 2 lantibiotic (TIGR03893 family)|uniref:lichenicidin A2 family type 2 lantibiotic n=2 Tax=Priestia megaterium TaxID=1404 RepID=UPI000BF376DA|nr:mersacidin family lantibiotic [Priestia megaterium]MCM3155422.1 mersacidin family lantibiotic [Priestia megaterium]MDC7724364.1 mersacidin family lantibiotic [Priestia megaterium]PEU67555.1 type 2 lantibiotic [Priestia megaterium]PFQ77197.1 type 2 lantibiotic [Priestia megaterium]PFW45399.1 type 2 lantibiotic [Priestia megaterium]